MNDRLDNIRAIRSAIEEGQTDMVAALIGADKERLSLMTAFGTWLHVAASEGQLDIAKVLVSLGADVNARGGTFQGNALNEAAAEGHADIVEYLLAAGSEIDVSEPERNPLFSAIYGGHAHIVKILLANGIDIDVRYTGDYMNDMNDMDALAFALERGEAEIAALLVENKGQSPDGVQRR